MCTFEFAARNCVLQDILLIHHLSSFRLALKKQQQSGGRDSSVVQPNTHGVQRPSLFKGRHPLGSCQTLCSSTM